MSNWRVGGSRPGWAATWCLRAWLGGFLVVVYGGAADDRRLFVRHLHDRDYRLEAKQIQTWDERLGNGDMAKRDGRGNLGQD